MPPHSDISESVTGDSYTEDELEDQPQSLTIPSNRKRGAVSAEVISSRSSLSFVPPIHPKTNEQILRIRAIIQKCFMFAPLDSVEIKRVIDAMEEVTVEPETTFIVQGDEGDALYLVEQGSFDVYKTDPVTLESKHVNVMTSGSLVGELALLYSAPRAATVISREECVVWKLDRDTFTHVVQASSMKKRDMNLESLRKVPLLRNLGETQRVQLADVFVSENFRAGEDVVREGESGDKFYILETGSAEAIKNGVVVLRYHEGDYFGELALLKSEQRAATIRMTENGSCLSIDKNAFNRLLGDLNEILRKNADNYSDLPAINH